MHDLARRVPEDLDLDVAGVGDETLEEHGPVTERGRRLAARAAHCPGEPGGVADQPHAAPAAAEGRLDQQREPDPGRRGGEIPGIGSGSPVMVAPGSTGTPAAAMIALASTLEPMAAIVSGAGPTKMSPASTQARANAAFSDRKP